MLKSNLRKGQVQSLTVAAGEVFRVEQGIVWLTLTGQPVDVLLRRGENWRAPKAGKVVLQGLQDASFQHLKKLNESAVLTRSSLFRPITRRGLIGF
jgi:hypothetical protein